MQPVLSREQARKFDAECIEQRRIPGLVLMENAGRGACEVMLQRYELATEFLVVCGAGNNAGDGFVVARRLLALGKMARVVALVPLAQLPSDAGQQAQAYLGIGGECIVDETPEAGLVAEHLQHCSVVIDALFGTGLRRSIDGRFARAIEAINAANVPVVSLDLPSGLDADTGRVLGVAVHADLCVTFGFLKRGLLTPRASRFASEIAVTDIGVPSVCSGKEVSRLLEAGDIRDWLDLPAPLHKAEAGRVLLLAGNRGTLGAARLTARGAHRAGAGLVTLGSHPEVISALEHSSWETMTLRVEVSLGWEALAEHAAAAQAVGIGPGLGTDDQTLELVRAAARHCVCPLVLDADALLAFSGQLEILKAAAGPRILTPHPKEAARLLGCDTADVEADRFAAVTRLSELSSATVLLKGAYSLISSPAGELWINPCQSAALAVGGSGDVLTGVISALVTRLPAAPATACGAWLHGKAGEYWVARQGTWRGGLARQIADAVPHVVGELCPAARRGSAFSRPS
jgi:NAD(P)H-hydrate epimerase